MFTINCHSSFPRITPRVVANLKKNASAEQCGKSSITIERFSRARSVHNDYFQVACGILRDAGRRQVLRDARCIFSMCRLKKIDERRQRQTGVAPRRSRSDLYREPITDCKSDFNYDSPVFFFDRLFIGDRRHLRFPLVGVLRPTCITRYLISSVSTIVTGVDPDTLPSTNCGTTLISFVRLRTASKLIGRLRQDCGTKYFMFSSREEA